MKTFGTILLSIALVSASVMATTEIDAQKTRMKAIENHCAGYDHDSGKFKWEPALTLTMGEPTLDNAISTPVVAVAKKQKKLDHPKVSHPSSVHPS